MDAASIEQMNKLRKSLGLPLVPVPGAASAPDSGPTFQEHESSSSEEGEPASTLDTREAAGYDNWKRLQDEAEAKQQRQAKVAALKKARDASQRFSKLEGKGLGDIDDGVDLDAKSWLKSQHRRMKKIEAQRTERMAKELEERESLAAIQYGSSDLAGVHVAHEIGEFGEEEGEQILTLKDKAIDDEDDEDELESRDIVARENLTKKLDVKKKKAAYDVHANDEEANGKRKLLAQYDEDSDKKRKFTLDGAGSTFEAREAKRRAVGDLLQSSKSLISLATLESGDQIMSDYITEIKIKKPKKEKKKRRERVTDVDDIFPVAGSMKEDTMELDQTSQEARVDSKGPNSFQDDDDLQAAMAQSRRAAFKKSKRLRPEELAKELRAESPTSPNAEEAENDEGGLVFDETTAFVENLHVNRPETKPLHAAHKAVEPTQDPSSPADGYGDVNMDQSYNDVEEDEEQTSSRTKREISTAAADRTATGLEDEAVLDEGLGATLNLLKQRGLVKNPDGSDEISAIHRQRDFFVSEKRNRLQASEVAARVQRASDRTTGTYDRMSAKDRQDYASFQNSRREQLDQRAMAEFFNANYRPNVELKYVDEQGRTLDQKEAFKHLSHQFHGKGSGKQKTEKRLKKIEDEKLREGASVLDSSRQVGGMDRAQGTMGRKNKQAGVRLA